MKRIFRIRLLSFITWFSIIWGELAALGRTHPAPHLSKMRNTIFVCDLFALPGLESLWLNITQRKTSTWSIRNEHLIHSNWLDIPIQYICKLANCCDISSEHFYNVPMCIQCNNWGTHGPFLITSVLFHVTHRHPAWRQVFLVSRRFASRIHDITISVTWNIALVKNGILSCISGVFGRVVKATGSGSY